MALIVEQHVVADQYPVDTSVNIPAGAIVELSSGEVILGTANSAVPLGIAGDSSLNAEGKTTAYSDTVVIGANGAGTRYTSNRVSDMYDETAASQKITVYTSGGKFWISSDTVSDLESGTVSAGNKLGSAGSGLWKTYASGASLGLCVSAATAYDSGVPGTDLAKGSISLGNYFGVILAVSY